MKARVVTKAKPCVLVYAVEDERRQALDAILQSLDIQGRYLREEELSQSVGYLAGFAGFSSKQETTQAVPCDGCVCMCAMPNARMNAFLKALQQRGVSIPLKAMVTATNQSWSFSRLLGELSAEHAAIVKKKNKE